MQIPRNRCTYVQKLHSRSSTVYYYENTHFFWRLPPPPPAFVKKDGRTKHQLPRLSWFCAQYVAQGALGGYCKNVQAVKSWYLFSIGQYRYNLKSVFGLLIATESGTTWARLHCIPAHAMPECSVLKTATMAFMITLWVIPLCSPCLPFVQWGQLSQFVANVHAKSAKQSGFQGPRASC